MLGLSSNSAGFVSLIGAGPGDPELLTIKAARRLSDADLVLFDGLVPANVVTLADRAQCFCVSKRARRRTVSQETIHRLMIRSARQGKRVVRLKCGDPFVLGRGGEEALALKAAGVPFEVIPGISAAVSAAELAGIPVTHRGLASGFTVVSGHSAEVFEPILAALAPQSMTVIVLMGLQHRMQIAAALLSNGWNAETPAAIVLAASTPQMQFWAGRLIDLAKRDTPLATDGNMPATIIIGEVTRLSGMIGSVAQPTRTVDAIALQQ